MPGNILSSYLKASADKSYLPSVKKGLVVTISREKGCGAFPISKLIIEKLHQLRYPLGKAVRWKMISKEILEQSADELKLHPAKVDAMMDMHVIQELLLSFTQKSLPNDIKIKNTIRRVIRNAAKEGNIIIIGRGGVSITRNTEHSIHIKLIAPFEWRVEQIAAKENISIQEATLLVKERDRQREILKKYYLGSRNADIHLYDLIINVSTMKHSEAADAIFGIIKKRQDKMML